jgi:hypothetical protein
MVAQSGHVTSTRTYLRLQVWLELWVESSALLRAVSCDGELTSCGLARVGMNRPGRVRVSALVGIFCAGWSAHRRSFVRDALDFRRRQAKTLGSSLEMNGPMWPRKHETWDSLGLRRPLSICYAF